MSDESSSQINAENLKEMVNLLTDSSQDLKDYSSNSNDLRNTPLIEHANFTHKFSDYGISPKDIIPLYLTKTNDKYKKH